MSTLKVTNLQHPSATSANVTLDSSGNADFNGKNLAGVASVNGGQLGARNVAINGAMTVAQRSTSETISSGTNGYKTVDRYTTYDSGLGTWTQSQDTDAPNGFGYSLKMLCTAADASPAASDRILIQTLLEGQNIQSLGFGDTSNEYTVSFYVKSNVTGTYILEQYGDTASATGNNISTAYTINSADTWERKTITLNVDSGAMTADNTSGLVLSFWLASGSNYTSGTLNTSWSNPANADRAVGQVNLGAATSNYWQMTGLQIEPGGTATSFEHEDYGTTLQKCLRYYWDTNNERYNNQYIGAWKYSTSWYINLEYPVIMRAIPTATYSYNSHYTIWSSTGSSNYTDVITLSPATKILRAHTGGTTRGSGGDAGMMTIGDAGVSNGRLQFYFDAEL